MTARGSMPPSARGCSIASTAARARVPPGSGLGLAIVKAIADAHGATVTLADGAGGRGLSVTVSFPPASAGSSPP